MIQNKFKPQKFFQFKDVNKFKEVKYQPVKTAPLETPPLSA